MARPGVRSFLGHARRSFWLFFGGIWLLAGGVLFLVGVGAAWEERAWSDAIRTTGEVLVKELVPADSDSSTRYAVVFRFSTADGSAARGTADVDVDVWDRLVERDPIDIYYLPGAPASARLDPGGDLIGPLIFLAIGLIVGSIDGCLVARDVRRLLRAQRLLRFGTVAIANVTTIAPTNISFNRQPQYRITYSYRDPRGAKHEGDSGYVGREEAERWTEGARVVIRYDPDRPSVSLWVGPPDDDPPPLVDARPPASP